MSSTSRLAFAFLVLVSASVAQPLSPEQRPALQRQTFPQISISIFSGMPDPAFTPAPADLDRVLAMIDKLPPGNEAKGLYQNLGYRGFNLLLTATKVITVYRDTIEVRTWTTAPPGSTAAYKRDDDRKVETELIRLAKKSGVLSDDSRKEIESGKDHRRAPKR